MLCTHYASKIIELNLLALSLVFRLHILSSKVGAGTTLVPFH
jgi:hypothetical protein